MYMVSFTGKVAKITYLQLILTSFPHV